MEDRKKRILVGSMIGAVVIGLVVIVLLCETSSSSPPDQKCQFVVTKPIPVDFYKLKNIADSADYKSLATLDAYLNYDHGGWNEAFQSLSLSSIKFTPGYNSSSLELSTDCAIIQLEVIGTTVSRIQLNLTAAEGNESECTIEGHGILWVTGRHYACPLNSNPSFSTLKFNYICVTKSGIAINFVINKLEFEVEGNPISIKQGKYSTPGGCWVSPKDP